MSGTGNGPTRDDAYLNANKDCNALLTFYSSLANGDGEQKQVGSYELSNCIGPNGSP